MTHRKPVTFVPEDFTDPAKRTAGFVALTVWCPLWPSHGPDSYVRKLFPMVLLVQRWDGLIGFPGGMGKPGESPLEAAIRETAEEVNFSVMEKAEHRSCFVSDRVVGHLYHCHMGIRPKSFLVRVMERASAAVDFATEGCPFWANLADFGGGRGWGNLRAGSSLMTAVPEELDRVREFLYENAPLGIFNPCGGDGE